MYKTITILLITSFFFATCSSEDSTKTTVKTKLNFKKAQPISDFDNCLDKGTFQLLATAKVNLEKFISNQLLEEGEDLAIGYQRYCLAWTGRFGGSLNTKILFDSKSSKQILDHPNYKDIWIRVTELGDTTYTEELAYDEEGNEVIVKYIENYWTLNTKGSFYKCLKNDTHPYLHTYLINKEFGAIEPQDFALELNNSIDPIEFSDPVIQNIIVADLYLRLIAVRIDN